MSAFYITLCLIIWTAAIQPITSSPTLPLPPPRAISEDLATPSIPIPPPVHSTVSAASPTLPVPPPQPAPQVAAPAFQPSYYQCPFDWLYNEFIVKTVSLQSQITELQANLTVALHTIDSLNSIQRDLAGRIAAANAAVTASKAAVIASNAAVTASKAAVAATNAAITAANIRMNGFATSFSTDTLTVNHVRIGNWVLQIEGNKPYPLVIRDTTPNIGDKRHAMWNNVYRDYK